MEFQILCSYLNLFELKERGPERESWKEVLKCIVCGPYPNPI
jgi:hypothetical protein